MQGCVINGINQKTQKYLIYDKDGTSNHWRRKIDQSSWSNNGKGKKSHTKYQLHANFTPKAKIYYKWIEELNANYKILKELEEKQVNINLIFESVEGFLLGRRNKP